MISSLWTATSPGPRAGRPICVTLLLLGLALVAPPDAGAVCSCPSSGLPTISGARMRGNDLNEVRGACAPPNSIVQLQVSQQHLERQQVCPPRCPGGDIYSYCINQCEWTAVSTTVADRSGHYRFRDLDAVQSIQLIAALPSQVNGLDGVYTALRVRARDPGTGQWSEWVGTPFLEAFNLNWPGYEGGFAFVETRVSGAEQVHVAVADGPDDGNVASIALDVDEDTPNFWLANPEHTDGTVEYTRWGVCDVSQGCGADWYIAQSPSINVQSPPLGRGGEFPYVLGMVTAARPGAMFIATSILGPRSIPDIGVDVDVDVKIDFGIGFDFFSLF